MPLSKQIQKRNEQLRTEKIIAVLVILAVVAFIALMFYYKTFFSV